MFYSIAMFTMFILLSRLYFWVRDTRDNLYRELGKEVPREEWEENRDLH
jgi:hypothetical protein